MKNLEHNKHYIGYLVEVWESMIDPDITLPTERQFLIWLFNYSPATVEQGISVAATKVLTDRQRGRTWTQDEVIRYASGVMRNVQQSTNMNMEPRHV